MADRVLVMYGGRVVESGTVDDIFYEPQHPYTWGLLGSVPRLDLKADARLATIPGQPPNMLNMDDNRCPFAHRCKWVHDACLEGFPAYDDVSPTHRAACTLDAKARTELARSELAPVQVRGGGGMSEPTATDTPLDDEEPPLDPEALLSVRGLKKHFPIKSGVLRRQTGSVYAVDGVSFDVQAGETLGLVGESGCGKSTTARLVLRLIEPTAGQVMLDGVDLRALSSSELKTARSDMQIIFQDPYASLDPRMRVREIIDEPLVRSHRSRRAGPPRARFRAPGARRPAARARATAIPTSSRAGSGSASASPARWRLDPKLVMLRRAGVGAGRLDPGPDHQPAGRPAGGVRLAYVFIAHDLSVVRAHLRPGRGDVSRPDRRDRRRPMRSTRIPQHPYTQALLSAVPLPDPRLERQRSRIVLEGDVPSPANPPSGCHFHPRCWKAQEICKTTYPKLEPKQAGGHMTACHFPDLPADPPA